MLAVISQFLFPLTSLGSLVKNGEPVLTDPDVELAAQQLPTVIAVLGGISKVFNTTFWRTVLCKKRQKTRKNLNLFPMSPLSTVSS